MSKFGKLGKKGRSLQFVIPVDLEFYLTVELYLLQIEEIVRRYGLVCITRNGSDPRKFIYESDVLTRNQVK